MKIFSFPQINQQNTLLKKPEQDSTPVKSAETKKIYNLPDYRYNSVLSPSITSFKGNGEIKLIKRSVQPVLDTCRYGKQDLFEHIEDLSVRSENGKNYLDGFYTPEDKNDEITGICEELSQKAGQIIADKFKDKYSVLVLFTKGTKYGFSGHTCLCMVKNNKQNKKILSKVEYINQIYRRMTQLEAELYENPGCHEKQAEYGQLKDLYKKETEANKKRIAHSNLWEDAIFIDPSFNIIKKLSKKPQDYTLTGFNTLENNNPYNRSKQIPSPETKTPLGFIHNIAPQMELNEGFSPESLVLFGLSPAENSKLDLRIIDPEHKNEKTISSSTLNEYYPNDNITSLINKIESELKNIAA